MLIKSFQNKTLKNVNVFLFLFEKDLYDQSSPDIAPEIVTPSNYSENNSGTNRNTKNGRSIKRNSIQPETAVPLKLRVEEVEEVEEFMSSYKNSLTPASLRLYFYLAYQFIQQYYIKNELKQVGDSIYRKSKNNRKLVAKL